MPIWKAKKDNQPWHEQQREQAKPAGVTFALHEVDATPEKEAQSTQPDDQPKSKADSLTAFTAVHSSPKHYPKP